MAVVTRFTADGVSRRGRLDFDLKQVQDSGGDGATLKPTPLMRGPAMGLLSSHPPPLLRWCAMIGTSPKAMNSPWNLDVIAAGAA